MAMCKKKNGRPLKQTQDMSCRVPPDFKQSFEAEAQAAGMSNGDYLLTIYNDLQSTLGDLRNLRTLQKEAEIIERIIS